MKANRNLKTNIRLALGTLLLISAAHISFSLSLEPSITVGETSCTNEGVLPCRLQGGGTRLISG